MYSIIKQAAAWPEPARHPEDEDKCFGNEGKTETPDLHLQDLGALKRLIFTGRLSQHVHNFFFSVLPYLQ